MKYSGMLNRLTTLTLLATASLTAVVFLIPGQSWGNGFSNMSSLQDNQNHSLIESLKNYVPPANSSPPGGSITGGTRAYVPPATSSAPRRRTAGGTRGAGGCDGTAPINLTALAPQQHIGQTANTRPTFVWYVADEKSYPVELLLYRYASEDPMDPLELVGRFDPGPSQKGYMSLTLPDDQPALISGETYRWKIVVYCQAGQPDRSQLDEADLQVVDAPVGLDPGDAPVDQASALAEAGLWYDAIAVLSQPPVSPAAAAYRRELVASLAELEAANAGEGSGNQSSPFSRQLRHIADNP
jgi:hypothetical protein